MFYIDEKISKIYIYERNFQDSLFFSRVKKMPVKDCMFVFLFKTTKEANYF